jgi:hypothetical protein
MISMSLFDPCAEIIESSLTLWTAQCWQWNKMLQFGSLVIAPSSNRIWCGLVCDIKTGSVDPTRRARAYGKTEQELRQEHPQIFELLRTSFSCISVGYIENNKVIYLPSPEPPPIHTFAGSPPPALIDVFFSCPDYLYLALNAARAHSINLDDLLLASIAHYYSCKQITIDHVRLLVTTFCLATGNEYRRSKTLLSRLHSILY